MSLQRGLLCVACVGLGTHAWAQSSVQVYGLIDTVVETMNHVGPAQSRLNRMPNLTGSAPSRLGLRGTETLGQGLKAQFVLETGIGSDAGGINQGNRAFGRQAYVALQGPWGEIGLGRQYTMLYWGIVQADVIGASLHSMASLDSYFPNARSDNALTYRGSFSGLTLGASYSLGRDTVNAGPGPAGTNCPGELAGDSKACRAWSALVQYDTARWGIAMVVDTLHGGEGAYAGLSHSGMRDRRRLLNGYVTCSPWKLGAGYMRRTHDGDATAPRSSLWFVGASYEQGPWMIDSQVNQLRFRDSPDKAQLWVLRGTYKLSARTAAYASVGYIRNSGSRAFGVSGAAAGGLPMAGQNQTGLGVGLRHAF